MQNPPVIVTLIVAAIFSGGLVTWAWIGSRWSKGQAILPFEPRREVPWMGIDLLLVLAAYIIVQSSCLALGARWLGIELPLDKQNPDPRTGLFIILSASF